MDTYEMQNDSPDKYSLRGRVFAKLREDILSGRYKENDELKEVLNQRIRIVVELNGAVLHAMSMTARPSIVHSQVSFANPRGL